MDKILSDDELLALPVNMLSKSERARRRRVKRRLAESKAQQRKARQIAKGGGRTGLCVGHTKKGEPCSSPAMKGVKHCRAHLNDAERAKLNLRPLTEVANEAKRLKPKVKGMTAPQLMRTVVETAVEKVIERYFLALGLEFQGFDDEGNPIVIDKGVTSGIRIHGESKEGYIEMSQFPDLAAQIAIAEKLMDRVYGKPKQTQVLEGGTNPIKVQPVRTAERSQQVADLLGRVGAVPHGGRTRRAPSEEKPVSSTENDGVVGDDSVVIPLRPEKDS